MKNSPLPGVGKTCTKDDAVRADSSARKAETAAGRTDSDDTAELVRRFRNGSEEAFEKLVARFTPQLYSLAVKALGSAEAAEEAVQESWVRIYNRIGELADPESFPGWATRVTLSRINDEFRARTRERAARESLAGIHAAMAAEPSRMHALEREDLSRVLREALESLDSAHRDVFVMREIEGLPHAEIARIMGIPEGTVWSRLSYARRSLREYLMRRKDDV